MVVYLRIAMLLDVHLRKRTNISNAGDIYSKLMIEVDYVCGLVSQAETQNERRYERTQQLFNQIRLTHTFNTGNIAQSTYYN